MFVCTTQCAMQYTMNVCMYHACSLYCLELAETIVPTLQYAQIAKGVTEDELKRSLFITR